jgi:hypothetical protein
LVEKWKKVADGCQEDQLASGSRPRPPSSISDRSTRSRTALASAARPMPGSRRLRLASVRGRPSRSRMSVRSGVPGVRDPVTTFSNRSPCDVQ